MALVWFIRHGQSHANVTWEGPVADHAADPLTEVGGQQAACIAAYAEMPPSRIITSPYRRALQTAQPTMQRFAEAQHAVWPVQEFRSVSREGGRANSVAVVQAADIAYWERCDPHYVDGRDAESFASFIARAQNVLERLTRHPDEFLMIFSHAQFIRAVQWIQLHGHREPDVSAMQRFCALIFEMPVPNGAILPCRIQYAQALCVQPVVTSHLPPHLIT